MSTSNDASQRLRAALIGFGGAAAGGVIGIGLAFAGVWAVRAFGPDSSSFTDLGVAAFTLVVVAPLLTVVGALAALRVATGRAVARPVAMTASVSALIGAAGALMGTGVTRFSLAIVGVALGISAASAFDRSPVGA